MNREMAFLAYYLHWARDDLLRLEHHERRKWCREVSEINGRLGGNEARPEMSLEKLR